MIQTSGRCGGPPYQAAVVAKVVLFFRAHACITTNRVAQNNVGEKLDRRHMALCLSLGYRDLKITAVGGSNRPTGVFRPNFNDFLNYFPNWGHNLLKGNKREGFILAVKACTPHSLKISKKVGIP